MASYFVPLPEDLDRAVERVRRVEEEKRRLEVRLQEEQAERRWWMDRNKELRDKARALLVDTEATRVRVWDLQDENDRLRGDNQLLDAENNQLRDKNAKLQQGTCPR